MSVETVEAESTAAKTRGAKPLFPAKRDCGIVDSDFVADNRSRRKLSVTKQHACGV